MTGDPRVEAAARALALSRNRYYPDDKPVPVSFLEDVSLVLAAADAAERPIAQRLADALRSQEHRERTTGVGAGYCLRCFHRWPCPPAAVLAGWDATQEQTT